MTFARMTIDPIDMLGRIHILYCLNLRMGPIIWSICSWQAFPAQANVTNFTTNFVETNVKTNYVETNFTTNFVETNSVETNFVDAYIVKILF